MDIVAGSTTAHDRTEAGSHQLTEDGNARLFVDQWGEDVRYCPQLGWLVWDGRRWEVDTLGKVRELARATIRSFLHASLSTTDTNRSADLAGWYRRCQTVSATNHLLDFAQTDPRVATPIEALDSHPWLLNVWNGTLDLRTMNLREHQRGDLLTLVIDVAWNPGAAGPTWDKFLAEVLPDEEVRRYLQRLLGTALVGLQQEHVLPILHGPGANGKTTFLRAVQKVFGSYAMRASTDLLVVTRHGPHTESKARLRGKRLVATSELEDGARLSESLVKDLTGGEGAIEARHLYQRAFEFEPSWLLLLVTNHLPIIRGTDEAIWRRVSRVPFDVTIPERDRDPHLGDRLEEEREAILRWLVSGLQTYQNFGGLATPEAVRVASAEYRASMDDVNRFIEDRCERSGWESTDKLHGAYAVWVQSNEGRNLSKRQIVAELERLGFQRQQEPGGTRRRGIAGLHLRGTSGGF